MSFICPALHSAERGSDKPIPAIPPLPNLRSLKLEPNRLTLLDGRDSRKVLVLGESADGSWVDLSSVARFKPESAALEADADGYLIPRQAGKSTVLVTAAGESARLEFDSQLRARSKRVQLTVIVDPSRYPQRSNNDDDSNRRHPDEDAITKTLSQVAAFVSAFQPTLSGLWEA